MEYAFLIVAAAWAVQFALSFWQLQRFHRQLAMLRKFGRCSIGVAGNRWRGRTYGVLVLDPNDLISHAALFSGWTVFSKLKPTIALDGMRLEAILATDQPIAGLRREQWQAFQNAAQFFKPQSAALQPVQQPSLSNS